MKLFGLSGPVEDLAEALGIERAPHEERRFEDGEFKVRPLVAVRDEPVYVYESLAAAGGKTPADKLCRLAFFVGALKDAAAQSVSVVAPYLSYARKDQRTKPLDPVTIRYVAQMLEAVGVDEIITIDVHNLAAFENAFRCRKQHLEAAPLFVEQFMPLASAAERLVVLSPDIGGVKRARAFAARLTERSRRVVGLAFMEKARSEGQVSGELVAGEVAAADVIVIDDLISGGTTVARAAAMARERGARSVHAAATHGLFSEEAPRKLAAAGLDSVVVTDTVGAALGNPERGLPRLTVLPTAGLVAAAIQERLER